MANKPAIEIGATYEYKGRVFVVEGKKPFGLLVIREHGASGAGQAKQADFLKNAVKAQIA